jgi:hypothetical protein
MLSLGMRILKVGPLSFAIVLMAANAARAVPGGEMVNGEARTSGDTVSGAVFVSKSNEPFAHVPLRKASNGSARKWTCRYYMVPELPITQAEAHTPITPKDGNSYILICLDETGQEVVNKQVLYQGSPAANLDEADANLAGRINAGVTEIQGRVPVIRTSPPEDQRQIVGVKTWFWLDEWDVEAGVVEVDGYQLHLRAQASSMTINPGDGSKAIHCTKAQAKVYDVNGPRGQETECFHKYFRKSRGEPGNTFRANVTLHYDDVAWQLQGPGGAVLDGEALPGFDVVGQVDLTVHEIEAVIR